MLRIFLFLLMFSLLTACATIPAPLSENRAVSWQTREQQLATIQNWNLQGAMAIRTTQENVSANLNWQQRNAGYTISLFGPLGAATTVLNGKPHQVNLLTPDGKKFSASNPEMLLAEQLHWQLPVSNLYYWIRGLPVPGDQAQKQFDAFGRLSILYQQGWKIEFLRYTTAKGIDLPSKLTLNYPNLVVKIVVSDWEI